MTKFLKKDQLSSNWYEIDAKNAVVGRLATVISKIIRGKNKTTFTPHMDDGDFVCLLYTSPSPRDVEESRMPSSA